MTGGRRHVAGLRLACLGLLACMGAAPAHAQAGAVLSGRVIDSTGRALPRAAVRLPQLDRIVSVTAAGSFRIEQLPGGEYWVIAEAPGHVAQRLLVAFSPKGEVVREFALRRSVQLLERVAVIAPAPPRVTPHMLEFEERRLARRAGSFLTREQLARFPGQQLEQALRPIATGSQFIKTPTGQTWLISSRGAVARLAPNDGANFVRNDLCHAQVVLDGIVISSATQIREPGVRGTGDTRSGRVSDMRTQTQGGDGPLDLNTLGVDQFEGVEYYPDAASTPLRYRSGAANCGTLLLWSRYH